MRKSTDSSDAGDLASNAGNQEQGRLPTFAVVGSAVASLLPLALWWHQFQWLFFFHDDWELLQGASTNAMIPWLLQPFLGEGILPVFKLLWISAVQLTGGSYQALIVLLWLTHVVILLLFGWLLQRFHLSASAVVTAVFTLGLAWSNMETLGWSMQWGALLAIAFLLAAWHLLLGILDGRHWMAWYVLCLLASGLCATRGILSGVEMAVFVMLYPPAKRKLWLGAWSLLPPVIIAGATFLVKQHAGTNPGGVLSYAAHDLLLNPLYTLVSYPGRAVNWTALIFLGVIKILTIGWAVAKAKPNIRFLLMAFLAIDVLNALALGYGRAYTGNLTAVGSRYQYVSLLCFAPALGWVVSKCRFEARILLMLVWFGLLLYPWKTHIGRWTGERGRDLRQELSENPPEAHFDPSSLTTLQARQLIQRYGLH